ncbi:MAG: hypothetical protein GY745_17360 [Actinomycetia bacterium]|nr:hypothetical protein [Actinomycetes bacterium]
MPKVRGVYRDAKGGWYFKAATHKDPVTGKWKQVTRRGFATATEAAQAGAVKTGKGLAPNTIRLAQTPPVDSQALVTRTGPGVSRPP